jgi:hypothetical protein
MRPTLLKASRDLDIGAPAGGADGPFVRAEADFGKEILGDVVGYRSAIAVGGPDSAP